MTAAAIIAIAVCAAVVAVVAIVAGRHINLQLGNLKVVVDEVNDAVNHKPEGAPTLYQHAKAASEKVDKLESKVDGYVADDLAAHERIIERIDGITSAVSAAPASTPSA